MKWISRLARRVLCAALLLPSLLFAATPAVDLFLPDVPPLTLVDRGEQHGIVGDIALEAIVKAGYQARLTSLPWPRAQRGTVSGQDILIAPLTRTPQREHDYTWIAPILTMDRAFFSLDKPVSSFEEAKKTYGLIAVGLGSAQEAKLREEGFGDAQIYALKIGDNPANLLLKGRVDAWFNGVPETRYIWKHISDQPLRMSPVLMTADIYLACSKRCDTQIVDGLRAALQALREDGSMDRAEQAYLKDLPVW